MNTREKTVAALLAELLETHMEKCDPEIPQVISEEHKTTANIASLTNVSNMLALELDDGSSFLITINKKS